MDEMERLLTIRDAAAEGLVRASRQKVYLSPNLGNFAEGMARVSAVAKGLNRRDALRSATWEPHDWSDWEA